MYPKQVFSDSEGRYVVIEVVYNRKKVIVVGIYTPNNNKHEFYKELNKKLADYNYENMIFIGDFNGIIDPNIDKSATKMKEGKLPKSMFKILEEENMIDLWRLHNMTLREYTFFSNRHKTYTRIDMILLTKSLIMYTKKTEILPLTMSDHNPVLWEGKEINTKYQWKLK